MDTSWHLRLDRSGRDLGLEIAMSKRPTATLLAKLRREAKATVRAANDSYSSALDSLARREGWRSWREMQAAATSRIPEIGTDVLIDPPLPAGFFSIPFAQRTSAHFDQWWDKPFVQHRADGGVGMFCLNGHFGEIDRPTYYGVVPTLQEALEKSKDHARVAWRRRRIPDVEGRGDGYFVLVTKPQRPDQKRKVLTGAMDFMACLDWVTEWRRNDPEESRMRAEVCETLRIALVTAREQRDCRYE